MTKNKKMMISALPFVALVVLLAVFCGIVSSKRISSGYVY